LVKAHQGAVFGQLRGMLNPVGRGAMVEDLAQETFLRAFRALPRFEGEVSRLRPWLLTIATRLALNELQRRRVASTDVDTVCEHWAAGGHGDPDRQAHLVGRAVQRAIADLPDAFRAAFLLREVHGLDYAEIAAVLRIDVGTVKSRMSRARARLRSALAEVDHA
jgi:RNA polymerase sigma-70 factor (ECF subfamily)